MYELPKRVQSHILPGKALSVLARPAFWSWIQMVSRGFTSREFAGRSSFSIKLANPSETMLA